MSLGIVTAVYNQTPLRKKLLEELRGRFCCEFLDFYEACAEYLVAPPLTDPLFYKENLLNPVMLYEMSQDKIAWMDSDVMLVRPNWDEATEEALEKYDIVQMFSQARDLYVDYEEVNYEQLLYSFMARCRDRFYVVYLREGEFEWNTLSATGFAWAAKAKVLEELGGLCDINPLVTAGDDYTAMALMGRIEQWWKPWLSDEIKEAWLAWQNKAKGLKVGYVPGLLHHYWHGPRETRGYQSQWDIVRKHNFTPSRDLYRDEHGLWRMKDPEGPLAQDLRALQQRKESNG